MRKEARIYQWYWTLSRAAPRTWYTPPAADNLFSTLAQPVSGKHSVVSSLRLVAFGEMGLIPWHMNKAYVALHETSLVTYVWESKKRFNYVLLQLQFCKLGTWASRRQSQRGEQITFTNKKVINTNQQNLVVLLCLHNEFNPLLFLLVFVCCSWDFATFSNPNHAAIVNRDGETLNPRSSLVCPRQMNENFRFRVRKSSTSF